MARSAVMGMLAFHTLISVTLVTGFVPGAAIGLRFAAVSGHHSAGFVSCPPGLRRGAVPRASMPRRGESGTGWAAAQVRSARITPARMSAGGLETSIEGSVEAVADAGEERAILPKKNFLLVIWEFSRPHTIIGPHPRTLASNGGIRIPSCMLVWRHATKRNTICPPNPRPMNDDFLTAGSVLSIVSLHLFAASAPGLSTINLSALSVAMAWALACGALVPPH